MISVCKSFEFAAAHQLHGEIYGKCANLHGHNFTLEVEVYTEHGLINGMVMNFTELKAIVKELVVDVLDHRLLNDFMAVPTAENMLSFIHERLQPRIEGLSRLRLYETPNSYAEWRK